VERGDFLLCQIGFKLFTGNEALILGVAGHLGLALRLRLAAAPSGAHAPPVSLPVHAGRGGLSAAVADPSRNVALLDAADGFSLP
jgi:hypothetical protein